MVMTIDAFARAENVINARPPTACKGEKPDSPDPGGAADV